jgi:Carbohydrate esterase, sialic acid-specific acetylesterase
MTTAYNDRTLPLSKNANKANLSASIVLGYDFTGFDSAHMNGVPWIYSGSTSPNLVVSGTQTLTTVNGEPGRVPGASSLYDYTNSTNYGLQVGTGDFTLAVRVSLPSALPTGSANRELIRIGAGGTSTISASILENPNNGWYGSFVGSSSAPLGSTQGAITYGKDTTIILWVRRKDGVVTTFTQATTGAPTARNLAGAVASAPLDSSNATRLLANFGNSSLTTPALNAITFWSAALSDADLEAVGRDFYSIQTNNTAADSISITSVANGGTIGTTVTLTGAYSGTQPSNVEVQFNGGAWTAPNQAATIGGGTWSGTYALTAGGPGVLRVREANATSVVSADVTGVTVVADSITLTTAAGDATAAQPYRTFQRDATNKAQVRITGTYTGAPTAIQYSWGAGAWITLDAAPSGGVFDKTVTLTGPDQGDLRVRFANSTGVSASIPAIGVSDIAIVAGQSNHVGGGGGSYVPPVAPAAHPSWVATELDKTGRWRQNVETSTDPFSKTTNASNYPAATATYSVQASSSTALNTYFGKLSTLLMAAGQPVALVPCALGSTSIQSWAVSTATSSLYGAMLARAQSLGGHKFVNWWQGEYNTSDGTTRSQYESMLNAIINDWCTRFPGVKWILNNINATGNQAGSGGTGANDTGFNAIHAAIANVAATNTNVAGIADMNGAFTSSIHYQTASEIDAIAARSFAAINGAFNYATDTVGPIWPQGAVVSSSGVGTTGGTISWPTATDDSGVVAGYEYSANGGSDWTPAGTATSYTYSNVLTPGTTYQIRVRAYDPSGNRSQQISGTLTTALAADTTPPWFPAGAAVTATATGPNSGTISYPAGADNIAVAGYEYSLNGGAFIDVGNVLTKTLTGLASGASISVKVQAYDAAGNRSNPIVGTLKTPAASDGPFSPSAVRTIRPLAGSNRFSGGEFWDLSDPTHPVGIKDPDSVIDIPFDWADVLGDIKDNIASVVFTLAGVTSAGTNASGTLTTIFVAGKTAADATVSARITTSSLPARVFDRTVYLTFKEM